MGDTKFERVGRDELRAVGLTGFMELGEAGTY